MGGPERHGSRRDLCFTPATELVRLFRARRVSPLELMHALLARIDAVNPTVNAIVTLAREAALAEARRATAALRRSARLGPLHGVPVAIKDVTPTRGLRTTFGSTLFAEHVPTEDAVVVARLVEAGAIVIGKTNTPEFAYGPNTVNAVFGATRNPWNTDLTSGGSSGGSAVALATGMVPLAEGTDLGGSLRGPASFCGVIGFRTTPGLIPRYPDVLGWDSYSVEGRCPHGGRHRPHALGHGGPDDRAPSSYEVDARAFGAAVRRPSVRNWRLAWTPDLGGLVAVDPEVAAICAQAVGTFKKLGARVEEASADMSDVPEIVRLTRGFPHGGPPWRADAEHRAVLRAGLVENTELGLSLSSSDVARGERMRTALWHRVRTSMETRDLWITPTAAVPPFPIDQPHPTAVDGRPVGRAMQRSYLTYAFSLLGLPAISIPCGFTRAGLPVGLQIVGRRKQEAAVLTAAAALEAAQPWSARRPPVLSGA